MSIRPHQKQKDDPRYKSTWVVDYYPRGRKGKRIRQNFVGTEGEAIAYELKLRRSGPKRALIDSQVNSLIPLWLEFYKNNQAESTHADAVACLVSLVPYFGKMYVEQLNPDFIEQYKSLRRNQFTKNTAATDSPKYLSKRTINKELSYLSSLLTWAAEHGHTSPVRFRIRPFPRVRSPKPRPLSKQQVDTLVEFIEPEYKVLLLLMVDGGLRRNEALNMRGEDIDIERDIMFVKGKGGKERVVPIITRRLLKALKDNFKAGVNGFLVLNEKTKKPYTTMRKPLERARVKAKIEQHIYHHLLRHSFGTYAASEGVSLAALQDIMGHSDPKITRIYSQLAAEHLKAATKRMRE